MSGADLGAVFGGLLKAISVAKHKVTRYESIFTSMESKISCIVETVKDLHEAPGCDDESMETIIKGEEVVNKCSSELTGFCSCFKISGYTQKLLKLEDSLDKFLQVKQEQQRNHKEALAKGRETQREREEMKRLKEQQERDQEHINLAKMEEMTRLKKQEATDQERALAQMEEIRRQRERDQEEALARIQEIKRQQEKEQREALAKIEEAKRQQEWEKEAALARIEEMKRLNDQQAIDQQNIRGKVDEIKRQQARYQQEALSKIEDKSQNAIHQETKRLDVPHPQVRESKEAEFGQVDNEEHRQLSLNEKHHQLGSKGKTWWKVN